jgi:hypothetical protein
LEDKTLNSQNPFADVLKNYIPHAASKNHMTFAEQCGYYGALMLGVPMPAVAAAAGIANPTASYLKRAGASVSGQMRYPKVAEEYRSLGHETFIQKYLTPAIHARCVAALSNYQKGLLEPRYTGAARTSRAKGYAGVHNLKPRSDLSPDAWTIKIYRHEGQWFAAIIVTPMRGEVPFEHAQKLGPYPTDRDCFLTVRKQLTPSEEEIQ